MKAGTNTPTLLSLLLICILGSCSKKDNPALPGDGMYASKQFEDAEINVLQVEYSRRANFQQLQYTSELTKSVELTKDTLRMKMDVYMPPNATPIKKQPLLVMIHGGGFVGGDKNAWKPEAFTYATAGYICATINYRLTRQGGNQSPELRMYAVTTALEDAQNAIRFLKKNADTYFIDTSRIIVFGGSAGGALSLLNAIEYDAGSGTSDWPGFSSRTNGSISTGASLVNDDPANQPGSFQYDAWDSPVLMFHAKEYDSNNNNYTWTQNAVPTQQAINASGNSCILVAQPDMTHTVNLSLGGEYWQDLQPFLWGRLRLDEL
ncbi:alpha/beta hydrolase [Ferruginibacter sp. HRS2-29]|uniref:alpha/beta hydrolase n=1 Tax=Ferruginibacter sp. HRS2-29 TaxID=2487334 RepID=UPI0020CE4CD3|nr:alpha/beta hydrolase [Ferruginibacter sp. HRS2-29]MCP9753496.1 alpha/beta hydrolase [Ferruginibacter sp. HRS2-29]